MSEMRLKITEVRRVAVETLTKIILQTIKCAMQLGSKCNEVSLLVFPNQTDSLAFVSLSKKRKKYP